MTLLTGASSVNALPVTSTTSIPPAAADALAESEAAEADSLDADADSLDAEADSLDAEADSLDAEADVLDAEADSLDAEADALDALPEPLEQATMNSASMAANTRPAKTLNLTDCFIVPFLLSPNTTS